MASHRKITFGIRRGLSEREEEKAYWLRTEGKGKKALFIPE